MLYLLDTNILIQVVRGNGTYLSLLEEILDEAGSLKCRWTQKGRQLTVEDTLVAAVAMDYGCTLVTANGKDFPMPEVLLHKHKP